MTTDQQPFLEHFQELRRRVLYCFLWIVTGSFIGYRYYDTIFAVLLHPLQQQLYYSSPAGGFDVLFQVSLLTGVLGGVPFIFYQGMKFLSPVLPPVVQKVLWRYVVASGVLLVAGMSFAYFICLPAALMFFQSFGSEHLTSLISTQAYFSFLFRYLLGFGFLFQMPLILLLLNSIRPLPVVKLVKSGRFVLLGSAIVAAVITPTPDIVNQGILIVPIVLLYYISIAIIWQVNKNKVI